MGCKVSTQSMPVVETTSKSKSLIDLPGQILPKVRRQESLGTAIGFDEFNQSLDDIFLEIFNVDFQARGRREEVKTVRKEVIETPLGVCNAGEEKETTLEAADKVIEEEKEETEEKEAESEKKEKGEEKAETSNSKKEGFVSAIVSSMKSKFTPAVPKEDGGKISFNPNSMAPLPEGCSAAESEEFTEKEAAAKNYIDLINDVEEGDGSGLMAPVTGLMDRHKYVSQKNSSQVVKMKPFMKELTRKLPKNLKADPNGCIFVRFDEERPSFLQAIITGVRDTPYENGCFLFDIHCPNNYPDTNPAVTHTTLGAANVTANNGPGGFSPNLHKGTGKVCLSLLGTWQGQGWDKNKHSIYTVLSSIMWGILGAEHPYYNEPGHGGWEGTAPKTGHSSKVIEYDSRVMVGTCRYAIAQMIKSPPKGFENVIKAHFKAKEAEIRETMKTWTSRCNSTNKAQLKAAIKEVEAALDTL